MERIGVVSSHGKPLTLLGPELKPGDQAPEFTVLDKDLREVHLRDFASKIKVFSVTPSLDTPVCDLQARRFNEEASGMPGDVVVINVSVDLPFAINRFCVAAGIDRVTALSDHRDTSFGLAYGVLIKETRLLARAVFIVGSDDIIRYVQIVPELSTHPDYDKPLAALEMLR